jgi:hypothetical protein
LYEGFGEDHSSFGLITYGEAKQRKDVLQPMFSRRAIISVQGIVRKNVGNITTTFKKEADNGRWIT